MAALCIGCALLLWPETLVTADAMGNDDDRVGVADAMGTDNRLGAANANGFGCKTILGSATTMAMDWSDSAFVEGAVLLANPEQPRLPVPPQLATTATSRLIPLPFLIPCP
jgi:hypothetical protein